MINVDVLEILIPPCSHDTKIKLTTKKFGRSWFQELKTFFKNFRDKNIHFIWDQIQITL